MNAFIQFVKANRVTLAAANAVLSTAVAVYFYKKDGNDDVIEGELIVGTHGAEAATAE